MKKRKRKHFSRRFARQLNKSGRRTKPVTREPYERIRKKGFVIKRLRRISNTRIERGLRILNETEDISAAARAIRVSSEKFKRAAKRKRLIRKRNGRWKVVVSLPRRMPIFSEGKQLAITVRSRTSALIGRYMSAVGQFLKTNKIKALAKYKGMAIKDINGKSFPLETDPNTLYRLASAGGEPFEEIYRIVI